VEAEGAVRLRRRVSAPAWDYPGNPLELLATMDELVDFLLANTAGSGA